MILMITMITMMTMIRGVMGGSNPKHAPEALYIILTYLLFSYQFIIYPFYDNICNDNNDTV